MEAKTFKKGLLSFGVVFCLDNLGGFILPSFLPSVVTHLLLVC